MPLTPCVLEQLAAELGTLPGDGVRLEDGAELLDLGAGDYLGLTGHPAVRAAAREALEAWGIGLAPGRATAGTQLHRRLERRISAFLGTEETILYGSAFDANGGVVSALLGPDDAVVCDARDNAAIADGIRLGGARRMRYAGADLDALAMRLHEATRTGARRILIATEGVFSMDGQLAPLDEICALAQHHGALVMVDDAHAVGVVGAGGRGTPEHFGVAGRVDVVTGTFGTALGGACGGYASGRREIVELLRRRSHQYLFSDALAPPVVAGVLAVLDLLEQGGELRERVRANALRFRALLRAAGFDTPPGEHPLVPVVYGEEALALDAAARLRVHGVHALAFAHPFVPHGQARVRVQLSAAHTRDDVERAVAAFAAVGDATQMAAA